MSVMVWVRAIGENADGGPIVDKVPAVDGITQPEGAWLAGQDEYAWWDEIVATGRGRRWLGYLAQMIGDGRVPSWTVSARQIRLALNALGLRRQVEDAVRAAGADVLDWWEYATEVDRYHPLVNTMAAAIGVSAAQVDELFALAETL